MEVKFVKKSMLIVFVLLFAFSASGKAQENRLRVRASSEPPPPNAAQAVYLKWKQETPEDQVSKLRCALATVARRTGAEDVEVEFWSVGRVSQTIFEIRPLYVEKLPNGEFKQEQTGEMTGSVVESYGAGNEPGRDFGAKTVFSVKPNTNALEIKWTGYLGAELRNLATIQILLKDEPTSNFTTISSGQ
jgi:hypothetical protein